MNKEDQYREALRVVLVAYTISSNMAHAVINAVGSKVRVKRCGCDRVYISPEKKCPHCYALPLFE